MKIYFPGDRGKAVCACCGLVETSFQYRDVLLKQSQRTVKNILVGVCDQCGATVSTPAQSTPAIRETRENASESIEAQLPSTYLEVLDMACLKIDPDAVQDMRKRLVLFYIHKHAINEFHSEDSLMAYQKFTEMIPENVILPKKRFSMKISQRSAREFDIVAQTFKQTKTDTLKAIMAAIKLDVLDNERMLPELRAISAT